MTDTTNYADILHEAHAAANAAANAAAKHLPDRGPCGFAWVTIEGNHPLARWCRKQPHGTSWREGEGEGEGWYGGKGYPKGHQWWSPGYNGQSIDAKETAARAFRDVLATHGIVATVGSCLY